MRLPDTTRVAIENWARPQKDSPSRSEASSRSEPIARARATPDSGLGTRHAHGGVGAPLRLKTVQLMENSTSSLPRPRAPAGGESKTAADRDGGNHGRACASRASEISCGVNDPAFLWAFEQTHQCWTYDADLALWTDLGAAMLGLQCKHHDVVGRNSVYCRDKLEELPL